MTRRSSTLLGILIALSTPGFMSAQQDETRTWEERLRAIDQVLPSWMDEAGIPGLAIAAVTAESMWVRGYGVRDVGATEAVDAATIFEAASLSKPVFAQLVLHELSAGRIDLDEPLSRYWDYEDLADDPRRAAITASIVLSHRTGLPNWRRDRPLAIEFDPGSRFQYSGEGYVYLERVLAHLRGTPLEQRAREIVFEPMGMEDSSFHFELGTPNSAVPHHSEGHALGKRPAAPPGNPAASLHTTAADYGSFVQQTLVEAQGRSGRHRLQSQRLTEVTDGVAWGLGWGLEYPEGRDEPALWHWGDNGPFKAFVYIDPAQGAGFVLFANSTNGLALTRRILQQLFPGDHPVLGWLSYEQLD